MTAAERAAVLARYAAAAHAMQSGVKAEMELGTSDATTPKHLRVGINSAMADHGALAKLLIAKGIFTEDEYLVAIAEMMESEVRIYETRLSAATGKKITLG